MAITLHPITNAVQVQGGLYGVYSPTVVDPATGTTYTVKRALANIAQSQTDSTIVAAVSAKSILVLSFLLLAGGTATTFVFQSNTTAIFPLLADGANGGACGAWNPGGWMITTSGEALKATTGAGSTTGVWVQYIEV